MWCAFCFECRFKILPRFESSALSLAFFGTVNFTTHSLSTYIFVYSHKLDSFLFFTHNRLWWYPGLTSQRHSALIQNTFRSVSALFTHRHFWLNCYCSSNKTEMVQLFKNIFAFIGVKFQDCFKKFESLLSICRIFTFSLIQEYHFKDYFVRFQHFGLRYHILIVSSTCVNIRADSE